MVPVKSPLLFLLLALCLAASPAFAKSSLFPNASPSPTPKDVQRITDKELMHKMLHPFEKKEPVGSAKPIWHDFTLSMTTDPPAIKLTAARQVKVSVHLGNASKKFAQLEFPTTQRIEVVIRDTAGKMVEQWSEDQAFTDTPGVVSINPGEHLDYSATLSTRDLVAGQTYIVEAFFPKYEKLRIQKTIIPGQ
jgi:hypothetical protein